MVSMTIFRSWTSRRTSTIFGPALRRLGVLREQRGLHQLTCFTRFRPSALRRLVRMRADAADV